MSSFGRRFLPVTMLILFVVAVVPMANAVDNVTGIHWHSKTVTYKLKSDLPASWKSAIREAAKVWTDRTVLDFLNGGEVSHKNWAQLSDHIVWRGAIPDEWQDGCPPSDSLACTRWHAVSINGGQTWHLDDTDFVFNKNFSLGTKTAACAVAFTVDVQTVAVHEFGHWGVLDHNDDRRSVMFFTYTVCKRTTNTHDVKSMNGNYGGH